MIPRILLGTMTEEEEKKIWTKQKRYRSKTWKKKVKRHATENSHSQRKVPLMLEKFDLIYTEPESNEMKRRIKKST